MLRGYSEGVAKADPPGDPLERADLGLESAGGRPERLIDGTVEWPWRGEGLALPSTGCLANWCAGDDGACLSSTGDSTLFDLPLS